LIKNLYTKIYILVFNKEIEYLMTTN